jgi:hypothetical protein
MLVPPVMIIAIIMFAIFAVVLLVIFSLGSRNFMMKTERTAIIDVKPTIIVVVRAPADSIRPIIICAPEASYPSKTQSHKESRQHNKLLNHFYFPPFFALVCIPKEIQQF